MHCNIMHSVLDIFWFGQDPDKDKEKTKTNLNIENQNHDQTVSVNLDQSVRAPLGAWQAPLEPTKGPRALQIDKGPEVTTSSTLGLLHLFWDFCAQSWRCILWHPDQWQEMWLARGMYCIQALSKGV